MIHQDQTIRPRSDDLASRPRERAENLHSPDDPRVVEAMEQYLAELEAGRAPDRDAFLRNHADIADVLDECLASLQFLHRVSPSLSDRRPTTEVLPGLDREEQPAKPLGDYQIVREIGRGGMGVVYEAMQLSLGRRVALKVLPFAAAIDPKQLQRFKNEAQAAAHLQHPSIVQVYGVGCERGVHFYAMQMIEGQSLAALIRELRDPGGQVSILPNVGQVSNLPSPRPDALSSTASHVTPDRPSETVVAISTEHARHKPSYFRRLAELGKKAAEALDHAHQFGVVHRDVKPANLLVDVRGHLWITDFGLALFPNQGELTISGELLGTLRYMSPEQALGKRGLIDHRTDIYSLGATLYELATLQPVFPGQDREELLAQIAAQDPTPPRHLDPAVPVDLETILLKALAKTPAERYATAQDFADDLQRFLDGKHILARRPTAAEKALKWARRHRGFVGSAVALVLIALASSITVAVLIAREHANTLAAYERERIKAREADEQRLRAEDSFRQARQAVDFLTQLSEEELADLPHVQGIRRTMLEAALVYYQDFIDQHHNDASIQAELAASHARVTRILAELSLLQEAGHFLVLVNPVVQDDLKLSESQRRQVKELAERMSDEWRQAYRAFSQLSQKERRSKSLELARLTEKTLADLFSPEQTRRFKQIVLQVKQRGPFAFTDAEVVQVLQITNKQKEAIRKVVATAYLPPWDLRPHDGPGKKKGHAKPQSWKEVHGKILALFTPEQIRKWRELTGEPLEVEVRLALPGAFSPRFGPPGRFGGPPAAPPKRKS